MRANLRWLLVISASFALIGALPACGGDDDDSGDGDGGGSAAGVPSEFAPPTEAPDGAKQGGELTVLAADDIDYMDPGAAYYQFTYMVTSAGHRALLSWKPGDTQPSPDLAEKQPEISDDGKTVTFTLRQGVRFAPPVDREVTSADVKYAIERGLLPGVANGYAPSYLGDLVGFAEAQKQAEDNPTGGAPNIAGIKTPDDRTLVLELERPTALVVVQALSLPLSAPVPEEYAKPFDAKNPSTYGSNVVFTGPYMVENNDEGKLVGYRPGKSIRMVRNPNWDGDSDWRPAYLDSIQINEGFSDVASASRKILRGSALVNGDITPPPTVIKEAATDAEQGQMTATPGGGNRYVALNTQEPPFDDLNTRRAVVAAANRTALRNTRGGELVGPVATHYIPPDMAGFEEAGGLKGPNLDFMSNPEGDPELAAEYMRKAGFDSGKCEGDCNVTMIGDGASPDKETTDVFRGTLEELGFTVDVRSIARDVMFTRYCNVPKQMPNVCPSVGWIKDFNDAQSILQPTFSGDAIQASNNSNWPLLDVPEINKAIADATLIVDEDERAQAWGEVDRMITEQAAAVPFVWDNVVNIQSKDVAGVINLFNANWDLAFTSLKG